MGEHRDVAMPETDQMPHGFVAAAVAVGAHCVEARRVPAAVEENGRRQTRPAGG